MGRLTQDPIVFRTDIAKQALTEVVALTQIPATKRIDGLIAVTHHIESLVGELKKEMETKKNEPSKEKPAYEPRP
jgi:hypothetical protein